LAQERLQAEKEQQERLQRQQQTPEATPTLRVPPTQDVIRQFSDPSNASPPQ
jgi:hypothetical protein